MEAIHKVAKRTPAVASAAFALLTAASAAGITQTTILGVSGIELHPSNTDGPAAQVGSVVDLNVNHSIVVDSAQPFSTATFKLSGEVESPVVTIFIVNAKSIVDMKLLPGEAVQINNSDLIVFRIGGESLEDIVAQAKEVFMLIDKSNENTLMCDHLSQQRELVLTAEVTDNLVAGAILAKAAAANEAQAAE